MSEHKACRTHCCILHGCKYGYSDCPVKTGKVQQQFLCEECGWMLDEYPSHAQELAKVEALSNKLDKSD